MTATVVLVAATVTAVVLLPGGSPSASDANSRAAQEPPRSTAPEAPAATDVPAPALRPILLTASEIPGNTGAGALVLAQDSAELLNDSATIDNQACLSAWAPAQQLVYADPGPLAKAGVQGAAVQELRSVNAKPLQNSVVQAAVAMPSQLAAINFVQIQQEKWHACAGTAITVTPAGESPQTWDFGQPMTRGGAVSIGAKLRGGEASCQRGMAAAGNVVIDIRRCRPQGGNDVAALVTATANKVPRQ